MKGAFVSIFTTCLVILHGDRLRAGRMYALHHMIRTVLCLAAVSIGDKIWYKTQIMLMPIVSHSYWIACGQSDSRLGFDVQILSSPYGYNNGAVNRRVSPPRTCNKAWA